MLGSEDHYRELGYTALSRHRDECRFYVNAGEPAAGQIELEISGERRNEVMGRIEKALGRERAQQMALDVHETDQALRDLPDGELAARAGAPRRVAVLVPGGGQSRRTQGRRARPPGRTHPFRQTATAGLADQTRRARAPRPQAPRRAQRTDRARTGVLANNRAAHAELAAEVATGQMAGEQWLEAHGVELAQATVIERELAARRDRALQDAVARAAYEPSEDLLERIGQRPDSLLDAERWDRAAGALESGPEKFQVTSHTER